MKEQYKKAAEIIKNSDALLIGAGAGMGVDSGLPDFRGKEGFWKAYPPIAKLGIRFEEMANPTWFHKKPKLAWAFYGHRYNMYKQTTPHKGFDYLLELGNKMKHGYFVFTSNVDGHFQKAGFDSNRVYEIHGSINHLQCIDNCSDEIWDVDFDKIEIDAEKFEAIGRFPTCPDCGKLARSNILMFGDWEWLSDRSSRQSSAYYTWVSSMKNQKAKVAILEFGAGKAVPSVRMNSHKLLGTVDAKLIRINPRDFDVPLGEVGISAGAMEAMEEILNLL